MFLARCSTVYTDEARVYIQPESFKAWGEVGAASIVMEDSRTMGPVMCINFISFVSVEYGALYWAPISGTRGPGYDSALKWQASRLPPQRAFHATSTALITCSRQCFLSA